ncbi:MAG: lipid-A-disaccharide synthase [Pseudomonadales bacterium]
MNAGRPLTIGMVAGEASGDRLGAPLIRELRRQHSGVRLVGIGGPCMAAEGLSSLVDIERLSVNGLVDPLLRLPSLLRILFKVRDEVLAAGADCFVGIDFNFFNLLLAGMLKRRGLATVHYVSPTVWAWRRGRLRRIARAVDRMLTLYPFEADIYRQHGIAVSYVGHPAAYEIGTEDGLAGQASARARLSLPAPAEGKWVAILAGSRGREVELTGKDFLQAAELLCDQVEGFVIPAANEQRYSQLMRLLSAASLELQGKTRLLLGDARLAMTAADAVMVNSGTATLEALLLRKPMVMSYRLGPLSYALVSRMMKIKWFALPNILAGRELVKEFIQTAAKPADIALAVSELLQAGDKASLLSAYDEIHKQLQPGGSGPGQLAAQAVLETVDDISARGGSSLNDCGELSEVKNKGKDVPA